MSKWEYVLGTVIAVPVIGWAAMHPGQEIVTNKIVPSTPNQLDSNGGDILPSVDPRCNNVMHGDAGMDPQTLSDVQKMIQQACSNWQHKMDLWDQDGQRGPMPTFEIK